MKKLAVCIPVYNRKKYLSELLVELIKQIKAGFTSEVEICVSDNCSTDGTKEYMESLIRQEKDIDIRYCVNEQNLGMDRNFLKCVEIADAEYCWLMGSDDKPAPSSVKSVLNKLSIHGNVGVMIGRRVVCNIRMRPLFSDKWINTDEDYIADFHNKEEVIRLFDKQSCSTGLCSLLSIMVFNKSAWDAVPNKEEHFGTNYIQTYVCFGLLAQQKMKMVYLTDKLALGRGGNDSLYEDMGKRIMIDLSAFTKNSEVFEDDDIQRAFLGVLKRHYSTPYLCVLKMSMGAIDKDTYDIIKRIPYTKSQMDILEHNSKIYLWLRFFGGAIGMLFTEPSRFYVNLRIGILRFLNI